jgi:hypothetical protein
MQLIQVAHLMGVTEARQAGYMPIYYTHVKLGNHRIKVESVKKDAVWAAIIEWRKKGYVWDNKQLAWIKLF